MPFDLMMFQDLLEDIRTEKFRQIFWKQNKDLPKAKLWRKQATKDLKRAKKKLRAFVDNIYPINV
jgi:hypothetical protein